MESDAEAVKEVDTALERSRTLIETVYESVREVEQRLGIQTVNAALNQGALLRSSICAACVLSCQLI